jgi:hypothetical protein
MTAHTVIASGRRSGMRGAGTRTRWGLYAAAAALVGLAACKDSVVPNYDSPTVDPTTASGIQLLVGGVFSATRIDVGYFGGASTSFARDMLNFTNSDERFLTEWGGDGSAIPNSDFYGTGGWANEFRAAKSANTVLADIPGVTPAYSAGDAATIAGIIQTMKALDFMNLAEYRDTVGVPIGDLTNTNITAQAPILCNPDVWKYIVALLDSGNARLNAGGATIPITLPAGFSVVSTVPGPSTTAGSFAAFNRALAGKANLELAYAIARGAGGSAPTPTTAGAPDVTALTRADSAITASALYNPAMLVPPTTGGFSDPLIVSSSFSGSSGDLPNPYQVGEIVTSTLRVLNEFVASVDTAADLRWKNKFELNPFSAQQTGYDSVSSPYLFNFYPSVSSPIPIIRNEELVLLRAQVQLGLGNFAMATTLLNDVRTTVGGLAPAAPAASYTAVRDAILGEQRISTVLEGGGDRMISIRMYGLAAVADTTWGAVDTHATILPIPTAEVTARNNVLTMSCP